MTIEEAIEHAHEVAEGCPADDRQCAYQHDQLAVWLEELKAYMKTGLEPEAVEAMKNAMMGKAIAEIKEFEGVPIDHLCELVQAEKDGRLVVLPCKVSDLEDLLEELTCACSGCGDGVETYTTGYRYGHRNGQIELLQKILGKSDGTCEEAEAALKGGNADA